jgi:hypothetical protein
LCEKPDSYSVELYRWEPIRDAEPAPDLEWLEQMVRFIDSQRRQGKTLFVHCRNGVSRSGLVVTAYEMFHNDWTAEQALAFVKVRRPIVRPNPAFLRLLSQWQQRLETGPQAWSASDGAEASPRLLGACEDASFGALPVLLGPFATIITSRK